MFKKLFFLHIPKTAGLSVHKSLVEHFGESCSRRFGAQDRLARWHELSAEDFVDVNYLTGHIALADFKKKFSGELNEWRIIIVIREPSERLISLWNYATNSEHPEHIRFRDLRFSEFLEAARPNNGQCWAIGGRSDFRTALSAIETNNIHVYTTRNLEILRRDLNKVYGCRLSDYEVNVSKSLKELTISPSDLVVIRKYTRHDYLLFEHFRNA